MLSGRDYSAVNFYLGEDEDSAEAIWSRSVEFLPRVGDIVEIHSERDKNGNYLNAGAKAADRMKSREVMRGRVTRVEHFIQERGRNSDECYLTQSVDVFLKKEPP